MSSSTRSSVGVSQIGEYIKRSSCERRLKLDVDARPIMEKLPYYASVFNNLDPILLEKGRESEDAWEQSLKARSVSDLTGFDTRSDRDKATPWDQFLVSLAAVREGQQAYGREIEIAVDFDGLPLTGRIDFVLVLWLDGKPRLRLIECKSSRRDRTYHRLQVAIYGRMVRQLLTASPAVCSGIPVEVEHTECVVARLDEDTNVRQDILSLPRLDLWMMNADLDRLLAPGGAISRVLSSRLEDLSYCIEQKCDDCRFNIHCLPESARLRRPELLGLASSTVEALQRAGINTLDDLADLDPTSDPASAVRRDHSFYESLDILIQKARARRSTLPRGDSHPDNYEVQSLSFNSQSQPPTPPDWRPPSHPRLHGGSLRLHRKPSWRLKRHVSRGEWEVHTPVSWDGDPPRPTWHHDVVEIREQGRDHDNHPIFEERALQGRDVLRLQASPWAVNFDRDNASEASLLTGFFNDLVAAIRSVAGTDTDAPIHFYVWSRGEVTHLIEAFTRTGIPLHALNQLLGLREGSEQLIFSCLHDEADRRFGLGWTSRGLVVAAGLKWFGRRFHWHRRVGGDEIDLELRFRQDVFDYKRNLPLDAAGNWAKDEARVSQHPFEIRSRFGDSLPAPYWRAYWGTLHFPPNADHLVRGQINRYLEGGRPGILEAYLGDAPMPFVGSKSG